MNYVVIDLQMRLKQNNVSGYIRWLVITFTLITTVIVTATFSINEILVFYKIRYEQRENYLNEQKYFIRALIQNEVSYINTQKEQFDVRIKDQFRKEVNDAYDLARKLYEQYSGKMTNRQLQRLIINVVSSSQENDQYSKVFINTLDGYGVFYKGQPSFNGVNLLDFKDVNGNYVVKSELDLLKEKDEGFISYNDGTTCNIDSVPDHKVTYVKKFGYFNWYFGYKGYLEDYYEDFKMEIAQKISSVRFRYGGYAFLNEAEGRPVVLDGKLYTGDFNFYDGTQPEKLKIFKLQRHTADSLEDGGYFSYMWEKMEGGEPVPKISFVKKFVPCNWLIGAGFYVDEIDEALDAQFEEMKKSLFDNLLHILVIFLVILGLEFWLISRFKNKYAEDFLHFSNFFRIGKGKYEKINVRKLHFEEFRQMGVVANEMIAERKKVYRQLLKEQKRATESDRLKTAFLANMSHEIRTPMNAILGFSGLLTDENISQKEKEEFSQIITDNGDHLLGLINDIIDISKIESDQMSFNKQKFSLEKLIAGVDKHYQEEINKNKRGQLSFEVDVSLPVNYLCNSDEARVKQVLDNLIGNSIKFTQKGTITLKVKKNNGRIDFSIIDTGIGIPEKDLKNIFQRFVQANITAKKNYGGTGLGLAISENIVKHLGGKIGVKSKVGQGSEFYFYIPA